MPAIKSRLDSALTCALTAALLSPSLPALAHEGHGLLGSHWHASDAAGFVAVVALIAAVVWLKRK